MPRPSFPRFLLLILLAGTALCSWISSEAQEPGGAKKGLKVTISVYSGRPNPFFYLENESEIEQVRTLLKASTVNKAFKKRSVIPSILGYRGIEVENRGGIRDIPSYIAVSKGDIELGNKEKAFFIDSDRALEHFLLKMAREKKAIGETLDKRIRAAER